MVSAEPMALWSGSLTDRGTQAAVNYALGCSSRCGSPHWRGPLSWPRHADRQIGSTNAHLAECTGSAPTRLRGRAQVTTECDALP